MEKLKKLQHTVDICVVGGGMAGLSAAVAAARHGASVLIMQDRPMFGGNASSEVRMWVCGAHGENNRETGIVEEIMLDSFYRNPYANYSIWDSILFEKVRFQPGLDYLLNCSCLDAQMDGTRIVSITGWQLTTQTFHTVRANLFIDCSGDSILAPLTGAQYRRGREGRDEFGEDIAPQQPDQKTMGMSCLIQVREHTKPRSYTPPAWAEPFTAEKLIHRMPDPMDKNENYWYLELGGEQDEIADTERIRDELQDVAYGVWDFVKNSGTYPSETVERLDVDWIGVLPGKRESRRYVGDVIMTQHDVRSGGHFEDLIAYGGWTMDDHHPAGLRTSEEPTIFHPAPSPFGIPYRALYSVNIENLMFAGRNISVTHSALSATRVMATCATVGQAAGTAAALAVTRSETPRGLYQNHLKELQQQLMDDDCYLPFNKRPVSDLTASAVVESDQPGAENLRNGLDRPIGDTDNGWRGRPGSSVQYTFPELSPIRQIRLVFDSDLNRETLPEEKKYNRPMQAGYFLNDQPMHVPKTLIRDYRIDFLDASDNWQTLCTVQGSYQRLQVHAVSVSAKAVRFVPLKTWGSEDFHIFAFDVS